MSEQKKYTIQGKEYSLAPQTPRRLTAYCEIAGIKNFSDVGTEEGLRKLGEHMLNISKDRQCVEKILEVCLMENILELSTEDLDLSIVDTLFNDFFLQRFTTLRNQKNLS